MPDSSGSSPTIVPGVRRFCVRFARGIQYIELRRTSATSAECTIYSDQDYTNVVETVTLTIPAGIVSLRYIGLKNRTDPANTGSMTGIIDDVQFWNGKDRFEHKNRWDEVNT